VVAQGRNVSVNGAAVLEGHPYLHRGLGVTWPGEWVAVASSLGVRVAWDGHLAVTVTVEPELRGGTWGLCGTYTDDPAGKCHLPGATPTPPGDCLPTLPVPPDDFVSPDGDVAPFAASFGNTWKVP
ncbi:SSPO protein, partial [Pachyramphus minor]|nr:SSPO protein [Pachyramphus minor]